METRQPSPIQEEQTPSTDERTLPDAERRALLKRLGAAAATIPVVTVLHDATKNVAAAS